MEIVLFAMCVGIGLGGSIGGIFWIIDPQGWKGTVKRLSTVVRAHLESSTPVKALEEKVQDDSADKWHAEFVSDQIAEMPEEELLKLPQGMTWAIPAEKKVPSVMVKIGNDATGRSIVRLPTKADLKRIEREQAKAQAQAEQQARIAAEMKRLESEAKEHERLRVEQAKIAAVKHVIVKKDMYNTGTHGLWPRWTCKCGVSENEAVIYTGIKDAQHRADKAAADHVRTMNEAEEFKAKSGGKFAW